MECYKCLKQFSRQDNLKRHIRKVHGEKFSATMVPALQPQPSTSGGRKETINCAMCDATFTEQRNLLRHVRDQHGGKWICSTCSASFDRGDNYSYHKRTCQWRATGVKRSAEQVGGGSAKRVRTDEARAPIADDPIVQSINLAMRAQSSNDTIYELLSASIYEMKQTIEEELAAKGVVEFYTTLRVKMGNNSFTTESPITLTSDPVSTSNAAELNTLLNRTYDNFADKFEVCEERGWNIQQLVQLNLHFPHRVQYVAQALNGVLEEYTIDLER